MVYFGCSHEVAFGQMVSSKMSNEHTHTHTHSKLNARCANSHIQSHLACLNEMLSEIVYIVCTTDLCSWMFFRRRQVATIYQRQMLSQHLLYGCHRYQVPSRPGSVGSYVSAFQSCQWQRLIKRTFFIRAPPYRKRWSAWKR